LEQIKSPPSTLDGTSLSTWNQRYQKVVVELGTLLEDYARRANGPLMKAPLLLSSIIYSARSNIAEQIISPDIYRFPSVYMPNLTLTPPGENDTDFDVFQSLFPDYCQKTGPAAYSEVPSAYQEERLSAEWKFFLTDQKESLKDMKQHISGIAYGLYSLLFSYRVQAQVQRCLQGQFLKHDQIGL
jgi:hypothetical protein